METIKVKYPLDQDFIPYGRQCLDEDDLAAVTAVLKSPYLTQGAKVAEFESKLATHCGAARAVAVSNGTAALHLACLAAGVGPDDEVITSPITFVASANCAAYCGARPVFADIDPESFNLSPESLAAKLNQNTKAVIPVHFAGQSCDMAALRKLVDAAAKRFGHKIFVIEDACHALGSTYHGSQVGSCEFSDMAAMSFHPVKHVTTGEGGAILTNDPGLAKSLDLGRSHGITKDDSDFQGDPADFDGPWYYEQIALGFNYRITDIQCALGCSQLDKLGRFVKRRREIVDAYNSAFANAPFVAAPLEEPCGCSNFHLYVARFDFAKLGVRRADFMAKLRAQGVGSQVHYIPVPAQPYYRDTFGSDPADCPNALAYYRQCLSLPLYPAMTDADVAKVVKTVLAELKQGRR